MHYEILSEPFKPYQRLEAHDEYLRGQSLSMGACVNFIGTMRDINDSLKIESMMLEHYPEMTEKQIEQTLNEAVSRWKLDEAFLIHRVGRVFPNETIVVIGTWSAHRAHAFEACRHIMEVLKSNIPIWKKEKHKDGERWVEKNTAGFVEKSV